MRNNRTLRILSVLLIVLLLSAVSIADAQTVGELKEAMNKAKKLVKEKKDDHDDATADLNTQIGIFVRLHGHLANIELPSDSLSTSLLGRPHQRCQTLRFLHRSCDRLLWGRLHRDACPSV